MNEQRPFERLPDYSVTGSGDISVFLLHGAFGAKEYWRTQIGDLSRAGYRVVAWDAPGYGVSPLPADFSVETAAQACARLVDAVGSRTNVLLGHSLGGMIAQRTFDYRSQSIHGLVLSATSAAFGRSEGEWQQAFIRERVAPLDAGMTIRQFAPEMLRKMMRPEIAGSQIDLVIDTVALMREETFRAAIAAVTRFDGRAILPKMAQIPVLCIAGAYDLSAAPPAVMEKLAGRIQAEYLCMPDVGHFGWAEDPATFDSALLDFLDRRIRRGAGQ